VSAIRLTALAAIFCATTVGTARAKSVIPMVTVRLSTLDTRLVVERSCKRIGASAAEQVGAFTRKSGSKAIHVRIVCKPHAIEESFPVVHFASCDNKLGIWRCNGFDALQVKMPDSSILSVIPDGVVARTAVEVVFEAAKLTVPPRQDPALPYLRQKCWVKAPAMQPDGTEHFDVDCSGSSVVVKRLCSDGPCHYTIVSGEDFDFSRPP
jgi:hypothetical protein